MKDKLKRLGKFRVSLALIEQDPDKMRDFYGHFVILRCECLYQYVSPVFEYIAYCPVFSELASGEEIPFYEVIANNSADEDGVETCSYEFIRQSK